MTSHSVPVRLSKKSLLQRLSKRSLQLSKPLSSESWLGSPASSSPQAVRVTDVNPPGVLNCFGHQSLSVELCDPSSPSYVESALDRLIRCTGCDFLSGNEIVASSPSRFLNSSKKMRHHHGPKSVSGNSSCVPVLSGNSSCWEQASPRCRCASPLPSRSSSF